MKQGNVIVEQVLEDGTIINGYDESLSPAEIFQKLSDAFPNIYKDEERKLILGDHKGKKFAIRCKNITYLGIPHPAYKKRIQISNDLKDFVQEAQKANATPLLMGIYSNGGNLLFASFGIETYINKKAHNSSAHVFTSDLAAACVDGYFEKTDYFKNSITVFSSGYVNVFLDQALKTSEDGPIEYDFSALKQRYVDPNSIYIDEKGVTYYDKCFKEDIIPKVREFFLQEQRRWEGIACYQEMIDSNYRNKYQAEWPGFYLEYQFEKYLQDKKYQDYITYAQDKKKGGVDLDLFFPQIKTYGDLKAHSDHSSSVQGNDYDTVMSILLNESGPGHIFYIVCEHSTEKDADHDYVVTKYWNRAQNKKDLYSYSSKMKNAVTLEKAYILDINAQNAKYLKLFRQGVNSNGKPRNPKISIDRDNFKYFLVDEINL